MKRFLKFIIIAVLFYFFAILQTSFFAYVNFFGYVPNLICIFLGLWIIFESPKSNFGIVLAFLAGLVMDIFFSKFIGYNIIIFVTLSIVAKYILRSYVRIPLAERS